MTASPQSATAIANARPTPSAPGRRPARTRMRLAILIVAVLAAIAVLAVSGLNRSLVFYRTPTELVADHTLVDKTVRLGGLVQPGTLRRADGVARFTITDGVTSVPVVFTGQLVGMFAPGQDALVEGQLDQRGVFHGDTLMVKHSDSYRAPDGKPYSPPTVGQVSR